MTAMCERCTAGPAGETGHEALAFYVGGPFPGHHIFNCANCDERWIRHRGIAERYGWTRYATQFPIRKPRPVPAPRPAVPS